MWRPPAQLVLFRLSKYAERTIDFIRPRAERRIMLHYSFETSGAGSSVKSRIWCDRMQCGKWFWGCFADYLICTCLLLQLFLTVFQLWLVQWRPNSLHKRWTWKPEFLAGYLLPDRVGIPFSVVLIHPG